MIRALLLSIFILLASCGGGQSGREHPASVQDAVTLTTGLDGAVFSRPSPSYVQDRKGVWIPLAPNEPGFMGGRRVKNLYTSVLAFSDGRSSFTTSGNCLTITHAAGQNGSPYLYNMIGAEPGGQPPSIFAGRMRFRVVSGPTSDKWSFVGRTWGSSLGSESNNAFATLDASTWQTVSQTAEQHERHQGYAMTLLSASTAARAYDVCDVQFEDLAGEPVPVSSEYVQGTRWFDYERASMRVGGVMDGFASNNFFTPAGGTLLDVAGAALDVKGLWLEPERTNTILQSLPDAGVAVLDGASVTYSWPAPAVAGSADILLDARSGRWLFKVQVGTSQDQITVSGAAAFRAGQCVWGHVLGVGVIGPARILEVSPGWLRVDALLPTTSGLGSLARVPCIGDRLGLRRNDHSMHYSTVTNVVLPYLTPATAIDGYQHHSVRVTLADALPGDGINAGWKGNENQPVFYYGAVPVTIKQGVGASARIVRDESVVAAGLGYLLRSRLVYELRAGLVYAVFDFPGQQGTAGNPTTASAYIKRVAGSGIPKVSLLAHAEYDAANTEWNRAEVTSINVNGTGSLRVVVPAGGAVRVALPQVEAGAWASSPIPTEGQPFTRAASSLTLPAGSWVDLTPPQGGPPQRMAYAPGLWGAIRNVGSGP